jgi:hypothetical protein
MADGTILATMTGEYFQPVRLHYRVFDHKGVLRAFKKLCCVQEDPTQRRWVWLYEDEAKGLGFKQPYAQIPKHLHPIVIGSFFPRGQDKLLLDLRSHERATFAIPFFDKHLPRRVAKVTEAEVVNKVFPATGNEKLTPDALFDRQDSTVRDPEAALRRIRELAAQVWNPVEKLKLVMESVEAEAKQPLPAIERFPVHYYEDGIQGFVTALKMRAILALEHWSGNSGYTMFDLIQAMQKSR